MSAPSPDTRPSAQIVELDEVDSTNAEAMRRAAAGERGPLWILARRQTAGRGRSGRPWIGAAGNLAASLLFSPGCPPAALPELSFVAGIAAFDAVAGLVPRDTSPAPLRLKWPNDLLAGEAKLGGILVESTALGPETVAVVGVGVNIAFAPAVEGRRTASLAGLATPLPSAGRLAGALAERMQHWFVVWDRGAGFAAIRRAWLERAIPPGSAITINDGRGRVAGSFAGLDADGALLLSDAVGNRRRFTVGDVDLGATSQLQDG